LVLVATVVGGWLIWPTHRSPVQAPPAVVSPLAQPEPAEPSSSAAPVPPVAAIPPPPSSGSGPSGSGPSGSGPAASPAIGPAADASVSRGFAGLGQPVGRAAPEQPEFNIQTATEPQILDHVAAEGAPDPTIFRFAPNPRILVLDFASLLDQGRMLNRVAALAEKTGLPHDRVLSDTELDTAVRASGDTVETYYYGHDYGASSLLRFFALGDRDNVRLVGPEDELRRLIRQDGWFEPDVHGALISIPQVGADTHVTRLARATILHHELSHGEYFTDPGYVAFVHRFWTQSLIASERDRIRRFLHSLGYDSGLEEVMENEAQAYLMFTDDAEFFAPDMIGMTRPRLVELRNGFFRAMPAGWLRESLGQTLNVSKAGAAVRP
jgi:hypothetical protein